MRLMMTLLFCMCMASPAMAGTGYRVTATGDDGKTTTYEVNFGGGFMFEQYTAYDPATGKFVYLQFKRGEEAPEPAAVIWDHNTGKRVKLYAFPDAKHPLPIIPSIEAMNFCPVTGDDDFKAKAYIMYD